jgi:hypothetical protein
MSPYRRTGGWKRSVDATTAIVRHTRRRHHDEIEGTGSVGYGGYSDSTAHSCGSISRESHCWFVTQGVKRQNAGALDDREQREGKVVRTPNTARAP